MTQRRSLILARVRVDFDDGTKAEGQVEAITRRGHRVRLDDGSIRYVAWWRLTRLEDPQEEKP